MTLMPTVRTPSANAGAGEAAEGGEEKPGAGHQQGAGESDRAAAEAVAGLAGGR